MVIQNNQETIEKRILYAKAVFGDEEKQAVMESMENGFLASGPKVKEFEEKIASLFGKNYGVAVNSGSSANLLALASLHMPKGSEVITPACTFATTVSSIVQNNLVPMFVDSVIGRYVINEYEVENAITNKTKALMVPQLVGGIADMVKLKQIASKHGLYLIDDSCDTLAPTLHGIPVAQYADCTTTSFYGSHIITALGMGGMVLTDSEMQRDTLLTLRDWGRAGSDKEAFEKRFNYQIDGIPYDEKFLYTELGYNTKMNEAAAAFGLVQLTRLPEFLLRREKNFKALCAMFQPYEMYFTLPYLLQGASTNWLAFPLTIREDAPFTRYDFLKFLESKSIQTRVLFSGNITRHPIYKALMYGGVGELENADAIMARSFLIGCHQGITDEDLEYIQETIEEFLLSL